MAQHAILTVDARGREKSLRSEGEDERSTKRLLLPFLLGFLDHAVSGEFLAAKINTSTRVNTSENSSKNKVVKKDNRQSTTTTK